jgi:hypothetical protein
VRQVSFTLLTKRTWAPLAILTAGSQVGSVPKGAKLAGSVPRECLFEARENPGKEGARQLS